jgi:hypothetical protein
MSSPPTFQNPHNSFIPNTYPPKIVGILTHPNVLYYN